MKKESGKRKKGAQQCWLFDPQLSENPVLERHGARASSNAPIPVLPFQALLTVWQKIGIHSCLMLKFAQTPDKLFANGKFGHSRNFHFSFFLIERHVIFHFGLCVYVCV